MLAPYEGPQAIAPHDVSRRRADYGVQHVPLARELPSSLTQSARYDEMQKKLVRWWLEQPKDKVFTSEEVREALKPLFGSALGRNPSQLVRRLANLEKAGIVQRTPDPKRPGYALWGKAA